MKRSGPYDPERLLSDRRSRSIFLARVLALVVMIGALFAYGLREVARPGVIPTPTALLLATIGTPRPTVISTPTTWLPPTVGSPNPTETAAVVAEEKKVLSEDGLAVLRLSSETKVLDDGGRPLALASIRVTSREGPGQANIALVGRVYEFSPAGATLEPPASLTISYDPVAEYPFAYYNVDCLHVYMAYYDERGPVVPWLDAREDSRTHSVTTKVDHLGTFIIFCKASGWPIS